MRYEIKISLTKQEFEQLEKITEAMERSAEQMNLPNISTRREDTAKLATTIGMIEMTRMYYDLIKEAA